MMNRLFINKKNTFDNKILYNMYWLCYSKNYIGFPVDNI